MQVKAIFEAAYKLRAEKVDVRPDHGADRNERLRAQAHSLRQEDRRQRVQGNSRRGGGFPRGAEGETRGLLRGDDVELPAAALGAGEIAKFGRFFSFGTNDLTQTTLGISRDDFTAFMPDYTLYDLINGNPFSTLDPG
jgi:pyruvate,orthophosphate dikinase